MCSRNLVGVIGGTGLYEMPEMEILEEISVDTPFGEPSDFFIRGNLLGVEIVFLSRHGRGHPIPATFLNFRANIFGFKYLGVDTLISVGASGSMKDRYRPTDIVIPDQYFDNAKRRKSTFFEGFPAVHIDFADPVCPELSEVLYGAGKKSGVRIHKGGTYICIDGPAFSTRAESRIYRSWDVDVIGMTSATEAKLAREAEMCYAQLALVTDYDVWKERVDDVSVEVILDNMRKTVNSAKEIIKKAIPEIPEERGCLCGRALEHAVVTDPDRVPNESRRFHEVLMGRYLPVESGDPP